MSNLAVFGTLVLLGSAVPFVPTGELVSAAAAMPAGGSRSSHLALVIGISWACSLAGDIALFLQARRGRRHIDRVLRNQRLGDHIARVRASVERNHARAVMLGRLIPGGRAPVLISLGASSLPVRKLIATDALACLVWSALYAGMGAVVSTFAGDPAWAILIAVGGAMGISLLSKHLSTRQVHSD